MRIKATIAGLLLLACTATTSAQISQWTTIGGGFYENASSWTPSGVPTGHAMFGLPGVQPIGLFEDHTIDELSVLNGADVRFGPAGPTPTVKSYSVAGNVNIDNGTFSLGGATAPVNLSTGNLFVQNGDLTVTTGSRIESDVIFEIASGNVSFSGAGDGNSTSGLTRSLIVRDATTFDSRDGARYEYQDFVASTGSVVTLSGVDTGGNPTSLTPNQQTTIPGQAIVAASVLNVQNGAYFQATEFDVGGFEGELNVSGRSSAGTPSRVTADELFLENDAHVSIIDGAEMTTGYANIGSFGGGSVDVGSASGGSATWRNLGDVIVKQDGDIDLFPNAYAEFGGLEIRERRGITLFGDSKLSVQRFLVRDGGEFELESPIGLAGTLEVGIFEGELVNMNGTFAPGPDAGSSSITGSYRQYSDASMAFDIGGLAGGVEYDVVTVGGNVSLIGGDLELSLLDSYQPDSSDQFSILHASIITGNFENVSPGERLATTDGRGSFLVNYGVTSPFDIDQIVLSDFLAVILSGDYDGNGLVGAGDLDLVLGAWGDDTSVTGVPAGWVNELPTGLIGAAQLDLVLSNWGAGTSAAFTAVPEPSGAMLLLGIVGLLRPTRCEFSSKR